MKNRTTNGWKLLKQRSWSQAEALALKLSGGRLPVPLDSFALKRSVGSVNFRPLLVDGLLAFRPPGFVIYIGCLSSEKADFEARYSGRAKDPLPNRVRFTLAHELAHTYLFELAEGQARPLFDNVKLESIEPFCNSVAARILLPRDALRSVLASRDALNPLHLRQISTEADVSAEALVYRLTPISEWVNEIALIGTFVFKNKVPVFRALSYHSKIGDYFSDLEKNRPCGDLLPAPPTSANADGIAERKVAVPVTIGGDPFFQEFVVLSETPKADPGAEQYYFSILRHGEPRPRRKL